MSAAAPGAGAGGPRRATPSEAAGEAQRILPRLLAAVDATRPVAIYTHDHPDPDAVASAYALQHLLSKRVDVEAVVASGGTMGRASNRAMVQMLGIRIVPLATVRFEEFGTHCLIDTQPGKGNHSLPDDLPIAIAIDHHPADPDPPAIPFADVRTEYGATSTMMYYYLRAAGLDLPTKLATALLFGIKSDTRELEREASEADLSAYLEIFPRADLTLLARIEKPLISQATFVAFHKALERCRLHGHALVSDLGDVGSPDVVAELADFLIPLDRVDCALVMGRHDGRLFLSLRTRVEERDAGRMLARVVGDLGSAGGHGRMAGGQVDPGPGGEDRADEVRRRFLSEVGEDPDAGGEPLVEPEAR